MNRKGYSITGMIGGALVILVGILVMAGVPGGETHVASDAPYSYDSGYAKFGADFYTFVTNNAEEAASASRTAANNLNEIASLLKIAIGSFLTGFGLFMLCFFGIKYCEGSEAAKSGAAALNESPSAQASDPDQPDDDDELPDL